MTQLTSETAHVNVSAASLAFHETSESETSDSLQSSPVPHSSAIASSSVVADATVTATSNMSGQASHNAVKNSRPADKYGIKLYAEKGKASTVNRRTLKGLAAKGKVIAQSENMPEDMCLDILSDPKKISPELNSCFANIIELPTVQFNKMMLKAARYNK